MQKVTTYNYPYRKSGINWLFGLFLILCMVLSSVPKEVHAQKKDKAKSNRKELREVRFKTRSRQGEKAYKGDISGRRVQSRSPRIRSTAKYAQPNPYAGRKSMNEKQRMKYIRSSPRFSNRNNEKAGRGAVFTDKSKRVTFTGKNAYRHQVVNSASRGSERNVVKKRIVPRTTSGAYVIRKRKRPYAWKDKTLWEDAYKGDIAGRPVRVKRTVDRPSIQGAPRTANRSYTRRGDKAYSGRMRSGFLSVSGGRREKAYNGRAAGSYMSATKPSERAWKGDIAGFRISSVRSRTPKWNKADGQQYYKSAPVDDKPYKGNIKGRNFMTSKRQTEKAGKSAGKGNLTISLKSSVGNFAGNMRSRKRLKGGGSVSRNQWNNGGRPVDNRKIQSQDLKVAGFTGSIRGRRKAPTKGGGSISNSGWNNDGKPVDNRRIQSQDVKIARFSGNLKSPGKPYKGRRNLTVGFRMHNNDGKPVPSMGHSKQDSQIEGFSGNLKGSKKPKGAGGSISVLPWNNDGEPLERRTVSAEARKATVSTGTFKRTFKYTRNPQAHEDALKKRPAGKNYYEAGKYAGNVRMTQRYEKKPFAADGALKGIGPSRAMIQASAYQGNVKMSKNNIRNRHPSYKFEDDRASAKSNFNLKLFWSKLFKKQENQPAVVKEKVREPRFDKGEKGLWND
ncbi:hypothetical protein [Fulvivirga sedimenti]|uniref:Uncharacterized protein n=1 Tax=Fulvivirga sedimenti TaxID=2879465 RepID=A0A9X1HW92_9BACT|nr:hypothetical protein [Fulvivirga sedimenti]MCA6079011.1 hypothetical protein [Fulvivirga sedimenti]